MTEESTELVKPGILKPRNPDENLRVAVTRLRKVGSDVKVREARTLKRKALLKAARRKEFTGDIITPEKFLAESIRLTRDAKRAKGLRLAVERGAKIKTEVTKENSRILLVVRNGKKDPSMLTRNLLNELGLTKKYYAVILSNTEESLMKLRLIRNFAFWGPIDPVRFSELCHKRLMFKGDDDGEPILVRDNVTVEERLGHLNMICIADVEHELYKAGPLLEELNRNHVAPFNLKSELKGIEDNGSMYMGSVNINNLLAKRIRKLR